MEFCAHCGESYDPKTSKPGDLFGYCPANRCQHNGAAYEGSEGPRAREMDHQPMDEHD